jgi:hypothetical protein
MRLPRPSFTHGLVALALTATVAGCTTDEPPAAGDAGSEADATAVEASQPPAEDPGDHGLRFEGPNEGDLVNAADLEELRFTVTAEREAVTLEQLTLLLDGEDVTGATEVDGSTLVYAPDQLPDGERTLVVATADAAAAESASHDELHVWRFEVKAEPPAVELTRPDGTVRPGEPVTVAGTTEPGATVAVGDETVTADDDGAFELQVASADDGLTVVVTDTAGNTTEVDAPIAIVASRVEIDEVRAVHATFWAWATPSLRDPIVQLIDDGKINAVQLDLKDEGGHLGYASEVPLAQEIGADIGPLDLEAAVAELHELGVAVIGRIVAFADPTLAAWAWENDRRDLVIQLPDGSDYYRGSYAGFSNYAHEDVVAYNLDLAEEAAAAGVDHILWDYIRRPEGLENYTVPGLETTPEEAIVAFARQADERLAPYGVEHGASVYGIAADRPTQIGQDIPAMAEHLDYVAPMIYPSHWGPGEYGVADPNRQPYDIIAATLDVWLETVEGRRARVVPWLEDTSYRAWDRPFQIREQIRATRDKGIDEWLMWNPGSTFTPEAYEPRG